MRHCPTRSFTCSVDALLAVDGQRCSTAAG
jgi:hypothetical protein